jgi:hypothetical protein
LKKKGWISPRKRGRVRSTLVRLFGCTVFSTSSQTLVPGFGWLSWCLLRWQS